MPHHHDFRMRALAPLLPAAFLACASAPKPPVVESAPALAATPEPPAVQTPTPAPERERRHHDGRRLPRISVKNSVSDICKDQSLQRMNDTSGDCCNISDEIFACLTWEIRPNGLVGRSVFTIHPVGIDERKLWSATVAIRALKPEQGQPYDADSVSDVSHTTSARLADKQPLLHLRYERVDEHQFLLRAEPEEACSRRDSEVATAKQPAYPAEWKQQLCAAAGRYQWVNDRPTRIK